MFGQLKIWTDALRMAYYTANIERYKAQPILADHQQRDLNYNLSQQWILQEKFVGRVYEGIDGQLAWAAHTKVPNVVKAFETEFGMPFHQIFADAGRSARLRVNLAQSIITGIPMTQLGPINYEMGDFASMFNKAIGL